MRRTLAGMTEGATHPAAREPLPVDASRLPALGGAARRVLRDGLRAMGITLPPEVAAGIDAHARLLAAWGRHVNLTAIHDPADVMRLHVLDSLAAVRPIQARLATIESIVDVGSGGGYPGIPVGLGLSVRRLSLVDSVRRKARFLEAAGAAVATAVGEARAPRIEVLPVRAEALAAHTRRETWDIATIRAVGSIGESAELGLPLLRVGGLLVCWKRDGSGEDEPPARGGIHGELEAAKALVGRLGGGAPVIERAGVPGAPTHLLVLIPKERPTPRSFPRPPAVRRGDASRRQGRRAC